MKTFSNMGNQDLQLTIEAYDCMLSKIKILLFIHPRDDSYQSQASELYKQRARITELKHAAESQLKLNNQ